MTTDVEPASLDVGGSGPPPWYLPVFGIALVLAVLVAGSPELDAPWILGDEFEFLVRNPDVNPAAAPPGPSVSLAKRLAGAWTHVHGDLYQPVPISSYAIEWAIAGGDPLSFRRTDLLLHAANALLLWWVLALLIGWTTGSRGHGTTTIAWACAFVWALHPVLVTAYAADMGRTHLLSACFVLVATGLYARGLHRGKPQQVAVAIAALAVAMLSKAVPGWLLVAAVLERAHLSSVRAAPGAEPASVRRAARASWLRLAVVGVVCVAFAALTLLTSLQSGLIEDTSKGLFGDPVARSALAVWIYARDTLAPLWISPRHLTDPRTGWGFPLVWTGLALALASIAHAWIGWRRRASRGVTLGWAWCWGMLLPVIGLVGAREAAAVDRYLYQPLMGVMLLAGVILAAAAKRRQALASPRTTGIVAGTAAVVGVACLLWDLPQVAVARSSLARARRVMTLNPNDPRAMEGMAIAYEFAAVHDERDIPRGELAKVPEGTSHRAYFHEQWTRTLAEAEACPNLDYYFPGPDDRGPFHRRLSYQCLRAGLVEQAVRHAEAARQQQPEDYRTWRRLAVALAAAERFDEAIGAYLACERRLPDDPLSRLVHFADFGYVLLFVLGQDADACPRLAAAAACERPETFASNPGRALEWARAKLVADMGLALCEIRYGNGETGFRLISDVLLREPTNVQAGLVLAEYHLRSHHWEQAGTVYAAVLSDNPTNYAALRGFHEVCLHADRMDDAVRAWAAALRVEPGSRAFSSYLVWAIALAGKEDAADVAKAHLEHDPANQWAWLSLALVASRGDGVTGGDIPRAVECIEHAGRGTPIPGARELERAERAIGLLIARGTLPPDAVLARAAIDRVLGHRETAREAIDGFLAQHPHSLWTALAERMRSELSAEDAGE